MWIHSPSQYYEVTLIGAGPNPAKVLVALQSLYPFMASIEAEQMLGSAPIRIEECLSANERDIVMGKLGDAGAMVEVHEYMQPFSCNEITFEAIPRTRDECEKYRFTYLPSFDSPLALLVWSDASRHTKGLAQLGKFEQVTVLGQNFRSIAKVIRQTTFQLSGQIWQQLTQLMQEHRFWDADTWNEHAEGSVHLDGARWHFEGSKGGHYKQLYAHSPHEGAAFHVGHFFFDLIPDEFGEISIY